jgi:aspartate ammonia-lyase
MKINIMRVTLLLCFLVILASCGERVNNSDTSNLEARKDSIEALVADPNNEVERLGESTNSNYPTNVRLIKVRDSIKKDSIEALVADLNKEIERLSKSADSNHPIIVRLIKVRDSLKAEL